MKKAFTFCLLFVSCLSTVFSQNIANPKVGGRDNYATRITNIETTKQYTVVSFESTASNDDDWFQLNKEIFIQTDQNNAHYGFVKSEGIAMAPNRNTLKKAGDKLNFKVYFVKIPADVKKLDIIERAGQTDGINYFNFYNVSLTEQIDPTHTPVTDVLLTSPPPQGMDFGNPENLMNSMMPMISNMIKATMDAQVGYYKQPGKIEELAKLHKLYYDALRKEGFSADDALKIITAEGIMPKPSIGK